MLIELLRTVSSTYAVEVPVSHYWFYPAFCAAFLLCSFGAYLAIKKEQGLPVWMLVGGMAVMPWINLSQLPPEDLEAIFVYLQSRPAISNKVDPHPIEIPGKT